MLVHGVSSDNQMMDFAQRLRNMKGNENEIPENMELRSQVV